MAWCFTTTVLRRLIEQIDPPSKAFLTAYTEGKLDPLHLRTKELVIDVSHVSSDVKVDTLRILFQEINFEKADQPGYMPPSSRQEMATTYTVEELRKSLEEFIKNVNGRVPFLGTPPAYDTPRLMAFYQQIEDAVRFSIHKVQQDLTEFQTRHGTDIASYGEEQMRQYKNLLENKARVALDMAIAGKHCGSRYMGESMSTYFSLKGETEGDGTLQDSLIELLASKRREIAQNQVYQHMGSDTHALSKYMATLGEPLGLPGTGNVVEHLRQEFEYDKFLRLFFKEYTVDLIIDMVQEKIKKSQLFREKISEWLKDQVGDWNKGNEKISEKIDAIQLIINKKVEVQLPLESQEFERLINYLREKGAEWPSEDGWDDFMQELFVLPAAKEWFKTVLGLDTTQSQKKKAGLRDRFQERVLGRDTAQALREAIVTGKSLPLGATGVKENEEKKIEEIRQILPMQNGTVARILKGEISLEIAVKDYLDLARRNQFLVDLQFGNMALQGASPEVLEWLLVSQQILLPQEVE